MRSESSRRARLVQPCETNWLATISVGRIPRFTPHTNPTPPDESDTTGQVFFQIRMNPTPPDHSDRLQPPHNPPVVGSIPTGPTMLRIGFQGTNPQGSKRAEFPSQHGLSSLLGLVGQAVIVLQGLRSMQLGNALFFNLKCQNPTLCPTLMSQKRFLRIGTLKHCCRA